MLLVDSTNYIAWQKGKSDLRGLLAPWLRAGELISCGIIRVEVLRGIRDVSARQDMEEFFDILPQVNLDDQLWRDVAELAWRLDRRGHVIPLPDLVIAQCAMTTDATLITLDDDFGFVPGLRQQKNLPALR